MPGKQGENFIVERQMIHFDPALMRPPCLKTVNCAVCGRSDSHPRKKYDWGDGKTDWVCSDRCDETYQAEHNRKIST